METQKKTYGSGRGRPKDEPSEPAGRKIWALVELLRDGYFRLDEYEARYAADRRTLQRDLHQLRTLGEELGFTILPIKDGQVRLGSFDRRPRRIADERSGLLRLLAELGRSFGPPVQQQLDPIPGVTQAEDSFLHVHAPALVAGSKVAEVYVALRDAATAPAGRSSVRFRYRNARGTVSERTVEPHHVVVRAGRYYLVGYDTTSRGWRIFALDAIDGVPTRAGTVNAPRAVPAAYVSADVLGFIKDDTPRTAVTVELNANLAASVTSRLWQQDQRVEHLADGRARLTVSVANIAEVIRWAFGFAPDARIIAPPQAVQLANEMARHLIQNEG